MGPDATPDVGAVIVTHSRFDLAVRGAAALRSFLDGDRIAIVVNQREGESTVRAAGTAVVVNDVPLGYGANLNRGVAALPPSATAVLLLNDDVVVDADAVARLRARLDDERVGLVGPAMVGADGQKQAAAFRFPTVRSEAVDALLAPGRLAHRLRVRFGRTSGPTEWLQGAALLVRRQAFEEVGGFDEAFHLYFEELDLARRLTDAGWRVVHEPEAVVVHEAHATLGDRHLDSFRRGRARYFERHWSRRRRWALRVALAAAHAWDVTAVAGATVVGLDRRRTKRDALAKVLGRRPAWGVRPAGGTGAPRP